MSSVRRRVFFQGNVQGVGFRYTTRHLADDYDVTGFVRNLTDGRVEVVAEGPAEEVENFVGAIRKAMGRYIFDMEIKLEPPTGEHETFGVKL